MKNIVLLLIFIIIMSYSFAEMTDSKYSIKGDFKECSVYVYKYTDSGDLDENSKRLFESFKYDDSGNEIAHYLYDHKSWIISKRITLIDKNQKTKEVLYFNAQDSLVSKEVHFYDSKGNLNKTIFYDSSSNEFGNTIYEYSNGFKVKGTGYLNNDSITGYGIFKYDTKGNEIETTFVNTDYSVSTRIIKKYDDNNNMIEFLWTDEGGEIIKTKRTYIYNINNQMIESYDYNFNNTINSITKFNYDEFGNREGWIVYDYLTNSPLKKRVYIYSK